MPYKETRARLEELVANKNALAAELSAAGTHSPPTDSLPDLTADAREVVAPKGKKKRYIVSNSAQICRGEFAERVVEYVAEGDELRFALEGVHILDAAELSQGRVGVVFTQSGQTKFKIISMENNALALGNTLILNENEEVEAARIIELSAGGALAVYSSEGAGVCDRIKLDGRFAEKAWSDLWGEDDPANICAVEICDNVILFTATREGAAWAVCATLTDTGLWMRAPVLLRLDNDTDVYAGAWTLCTVAAGIAALSYPRGDGRSLGVAVLEIRDGVDEHIYAEQEYEGNMTYTGALPSAGNAAMGGGRWLTAYGVSYQDTAANLVKSLVALEIWSLTGYAAKREDYGADDVRWDESVGGVTVCAAGTGAAVSFTAGSVGQCAYVLDGVPGPAVPLGTHGGFCKLIPVTVRRGIVITQRDGNGYARLYQLAERVIPAADHACGIALSGGGAGEEITVAEAAVEN